MIIHPDYNEEYVDNDVALLKFSTNDVDNLYEDSILTGMHFFFVTTLEICHSEPVIKNLSFRTCY